MARPLNNTEILELIAEVDHELADRDEPISIVVVGGAAIALQWGNRTTYDIDIASDDMPLELRSAVAQVGNRRGIRPDWLNDGVKGYVPIFSPSLRSVYEGRNLLVFGADAKYLLAIKLRRSRIVDRIDILSLMKLTGLVDKEALLHLVETAYPSWAIDVRVQYVIDEAVQKYRKPEET